MSTLPPRAVFVTRETDYELLLARHATREQARFFLETRGQQLSWVEERHERLQESLKTARTRVPRDWRQAHVRRTDLDRFLFAPDDIVVVVGQDGLVANAAKYLSGQPVVGVNPLPDVYDGILVRFPVDDLDVVLEGTVEGALTYEKRTMAEVVLDNGERLLALNELFIGHRSHQSARYHLKVAHAEEEHSSSGIIVSTGTGATGWARSIMHATEYSLTLQPDEKALAFFVREPFPSRATGTSIQHGKLKSKLSITSHMNDGGVIFADGIEKDFIAFDWGRTATVKVSEQALRLVRLP